MRVTLEGEKGYKRFLRDSYLTVREGARESGDTAAGDTSVRLLSVRVCACMFDLPLYYTKVFDGLECEWPLFFIYEYISGKHTHTHTHTHTMLTSTIHL